VISKGRDKLVLIFADFCIPRLKSGRTGIWGQGLAGRVTIQNLKSLTTRFQREFADAPVIWVLHFPPLLDVEDKLRLRGARDVLEAAVSAGVRKIFAGHLHRDQDTPYSEVEVLCTASASSEYRPLYGNSARLVRVTVERGSYAVHSTLFHYCAESRSFDERKL
jgi:hypothetical protein